MKLAWIILSFMMFLFSTEKGISYEKKISESTADLPFLEYPGEPKESVIAQIIYRATLRPLNLICSLIFFGSIVHILCARKILRISHRMERNLEKKNLMLRLHYPELNLNNKSFSSEIVHFLGEVEIIFGIWVIPLIFAIAWFYNEQTAFNYLNSRDYQEAIAIVVIMVLASSFPILNFSEKIIGIFAKIGNETPAAWWMAILTIGPLLGSFITEAGAMIVTCMLLIRKFYCYKISHTLAYATIGALFTNVSLGGIATVFASAPALLASEKWQWDSRFMLEAFGWKSILIIILSNSFYYLFFYREFQQLYIQRELFNILKSEKNVTRYIPIWVTLSSLLFLLSVTTHLNEPVVFIGLFFFFLGFHQATQPYQSELILRPALLVGFFVAGLVIHAGLQAWWISPLLDNANATTMVFVSLILGPFTDNALLTYLATLIPNLEAIAKYSIMYGAVAVGGLTVIANAPNPAGQQLLSKFYSGGISPISLFLGALPPALIALLFFYFFSI